MKALKLVFIPVIILAFIAGCLSTKLEFSGIPLDTQIIPVVQKAHVEGINHLEYSPDGKLVASASGDNTVKIWRAGDLTLIRSLGHMGADGVAHFSFSRSGELLASISWSGRIFLWRITDGKLIYSTTDEGSYQIKPAVFIDSSRNWLIVKKYGVTEIRDLKDGKILKSFDWIKTDYGLCYRGPCDRSSKITDISPSGNRAIFISDWGDAWVVYSLGMFIPKLALWPADSPDPDFTINKGIFSPDEKTIAISRNQQGMYKNDSRIELYDSASGKYLFSLAQKNHITDFSFSPDGKYITTVGTGIITVWKPADKSVVKTISTGYADILHIAYSPDGNALAFGNRNGDLVSYNTVTWQQKHKVLNYFSSITSLSLNKAKSRLAVGNRSGWVRVIDLENNRTVFEYQHVQYSDLTAITNLLYSPDGKYLAVKPEDPYVLCLLESARGKLKYAHGLKARYEYSTLSFSPDSKKLAAGNEIIDVETSTVLHEFDPGEVIMASAFSPDNARLALAKNNTIHMVNAGDYSQRLLGGHGAAVTRLVFSHDSALLASAAVDYTVKVWRIYDGKKLREWQMKDAVTSLDFNRNDSLVAASCKNHTIEILDVKNNDIKQILSGHSDWISGAVFAGNENFLYSAAYDGTIKLWGLKENRAITLLPVEDKEWFFYDDRANIDCSYSAGKKLHFVQGLDVFDIEQYWSNFFTPGLLGKFLNGETIENRLTIEEAVKNTPLVFVGQVDDISTDGLVKIAVTARETGNGVGKIFLYHNGRAVDELQKGLNLAKSGEKKVFTIELVEGENTLTGAAFDKDNLAEGKSNSLILAFTPEKPLKSDLYIISIGVSRYKDASLNLKSAARDADDIAAMFTKAGGDIYRNIEVRLLKDDKVIRENILNIFMETAEKIRKQDTLIFYLAGHGDVENDIYYYITHDADISAITKNNISMNDIRDFFQQIRANKVVFLQDTCKSGAVGEDIARLALSRGIEERKLLATLAKEQGIAVFSAANQTQAAFEIESLKHGIFTYALLEVLTNRAAVDDDGLLRIGRLMGKAQQVVNEIADRYLKTSQTPVIYLFGDDFVVGR